MIINRCLSRSECRILLNYNKYQFFFLNVTIYKLNNKNKKFIVVQCFLATNLVYWCIKGEIMKSCPKDFIFINKNKIFFIIAEKRKKISLLFNLRLLLYYYRIYNYITYLIDILKFKHCFFKTFSRFTQKIKINDRNIKQKTD